MKWEAVMKIQANVRSGQGKHEVVVRTDASERSLTIPPKATGSGSSVNGGELLFLALATCYCNDIYREAAKRTIDVSIVEVTVTGDFGGEGEAAKNIAYSARVAARASEEEIRELMKQTDRVAEIQNTLRMANAVLLTGIEAVEIR